MSIFAQYIAVIVIVFQLWAVHTSVGAVRPESRWTRSKAWGSTVVILVTVGAGAVLGNMIK